MSKNQRQTIKWIITSVLILVIFISCFILYVGRLMSVEDRYGDLQSIYWNSKDGDIIVNKLNSDIGLIEKTWKDVYVIKNSKRFELEEFLDEQNKLNYNACLYRPKSKIQDQTDLKNLKLISQSEFISSVSVRY